MSVSFVQSKSAKSTSGNSVSATFSSNITAGNGLLAAVTWIDPNSNSNPYPTITVADSFGSWRFITGNNVPLGGDIQTGVYWIPYCKAGPNGAVTATAVSATGAAAPGIMFLTIHEVAPNSGELFVFDIAGTNSGIGWDSDFSFPFGTSVEAIPASTRNVTQYAFIVFATRSGNIDPTPGTGMTAREYIANTTPVGSIGGGILGSQATFDDVANFYGATPSFNLGWSYPSSIVNAVVVTIASIPAVADPPSVVNPFPGEYPSSQSVTLQQDQGLEIHYTTDGSTPTSASTLYTGPISIATPTTLKAIAVQGSTAGWPPGFWTSSSVVTLVYDIYTGTCSNPANVIDGDDTTFAQLNANGSTGDVVAVKVNNMNGTTGGTAHINVDFAVTRNDLVAPSQTLPAWKVSALIGGTETVLASGAPGGGAVTRQIVSLAVAAGVSASTLAAKISAICQIPGSTGAVQVNVYAAYVIEP